MIGRDYGPLKENNFNKEILKLPVGTQRRFNVDATSYDIARRRVDVETKSCVYAVNEIKESNEKRSFLLKNRRKCKVLLS